MFQSNDLYFRKLSQKELSDLLLLKQYDWEGTHHVSILNQDDQDRWFKSIDDHPHSPRSMILVASQWPNHDDVGIYKIFNIDWVNRSAEVGWDVYSHQRGKGFGKKVVAGGSLFCLDVLNLHRLNCEILDTNGASKRCACYTGFVFEGVKREAIHRFGSPIDSYMYGLLRGDLNRYDLKLTEEE